MLLDLPDGAPDKDVSAAYRRELIVKLSHLQNHRHRLGNSIPDLQPGIEDR